MTNWKHTANFKPFWDADISVEEKGIKAAEALERLKRYFPDDSPLADIIEDFKYCTGDGEDFTPTDDFDARMFDLYEWADSNLVWVKTQF
jgi:hypothetical protein